MSLMIKDVAYAAITAGTTQTLAGATALLADVSQVTVGTASDGVLLPVCAAGMVLFVKNVSANAGKAYAANSGTIDGTAGATGVSLTASKTSIFASIGINTTGGTVWVTLGAIS